MKYIKTLVCSLTAVLSMVGTSYAASTNAVVNNAPADLWVFAVAGGGSTSVSGDNQTSVGGQFELGRHVGVPIPLTDVKWPAVVGIRQSVNYSDVSRTVYTVNPNCNNLYTASKTSSSDWNFSTALFSDFEVFAYKKFQLDAGANIAAAYGNQPEKYTVAPEAVGRIFLKKDVDLFGRAEYPFNLSNGKSDDSLTFYIGVRVGF